MQNYPRQQIGEAISLKQAILTDDAFMAQLNDIISLCIATYRAKGKILLCGNGGSAADAQHLAAEFVNRFSFDRPALPAISLTTDTSVLTSICNDYDFEQIFSRQVEAHGQPGDILFAISTSGHSENILAAVQQAKRKGLHVVGLTGATGGKLAPLCDYCMKVPSTKTPRVQEVHILLGHIICAGVERELFSELHSLQQASAEQVLKRGSAVGIE